MSNSVSFIHAADLHLDSPFQGLTDIPNTMFSEVRNSTFTALNNLVKTAINKQVDFVLLVGDLFNNERQSLKAQVQLRTAFEQLGKHNIPVYMSYGNHDYINGNIHPMIYPENVHIFPNETISFFTFEKENQKIASIYGFSYENRAVTENKSIEYDVIDKTIPFHIATLHGSIFGNKDHDPYAPFKLQHVIEKHFDYWALGHIHKREIIAKLPPVVYPGNTQGRHRHEAGEKGCYYVTLSKTSTNLEFVPLQAIQFDSAIIDVTNCESLQDVEEKIMETAGNQPIKKLIHLTLHGENEKMIAFENEGLLKELIAIVNESLIKDDIWAYIYDYRLQIDDNSKIDYDDFFVGEVIQSLEDLEFADVLEELYNHPRGRKFIEKISNEEMKQKAKQFLLYELLKVGR
ncbi:exonuclease SbcCD subunit D [Pseudogracilibacillus auburnensis]|uniref:DNA repair exonuclease SbcCD nuclease subunit n=1 Tax=Pseudogracilibacillus auburnensis TaxID=1494959 RepID=A0A2V3VZF2_9BACI|nr:DNA repair exonuclease [Pseudogracilibacillus auburnensis]PXW87010.1 DNA repair exonuclease SbcCD nuclease subunit [Pseudogracilibacillus auburnensis]